MSVLKALALAFSAAVGLALLVGCGEGAEWVGTVYPDREDLSNFQRVGNFPDLEACRSAVSAAIGALPAAASAQVVRGWECGTQCRTDSEGDLLCARLEQG